MFSPSHTRCFKGREWKDRYFTIGCLRLAKWQSVISYNIYSSFDRIWVAGTRFMALFAPLRSAWLTFYLSGRLLYFFLLGVYFFRTRTDRFNGSFGLFQHTFFSFSSLKSFTAPSRMFFFEIFLPQRKKQSIFNKFVTFAILLEWFFSGDYCWPPLAR